MNIISSILGGVAACLVFGGAFAGTADNGFGTEGGPQHSPAHPGMPPVGGDGSIGGHPSCDPQPGNTTTSIELPGGAFLQVELDSKSGRPGVAGLALIDADGDPLAPPEQLAPLIAWFSVEAIGDSALVIAASAGGGGGGGIQPLSEFVPPLVALVVAAPDGSIAPAAALVAMLLPQVDVSSGCLAVGDTCNRLSSNAAVKNVVVQPIGVDTVSVAYLYEDGTQDKQIWKKNPATGEWECAGSGDPQWPCGDSADPESCVCQFLASSAQYTSHGAMLKLKGSAAPVFGASGIQFNEPLAPPCP